MDLKNKIAIYRSADGKCSLFDVIYWFLEF